MAGGALDLPRVIGHRGAMAHAPENTGASLRQAAARGARWVEFDVRLTADGVPVVIHDPTLERTTDGTGRVASKTYDAIAALDAGAWFAPRFAGERVPTLAATFALLAELGLGANIEIKPTRGRQRDIVETVLAVLRARWPDHLPPPLLSSFDRKVLAALRDAGSPWPAGYLAKRLPQRWRAQVARLGADTVHVNHKALTEAAAAAVKATGRPLLAYTVDDPARARTLFGWGVDTVFSNAPEAIIGAI